MSSEYKERLRRFNATEKYKYELRFLVQLINAGHRDKVLDIGCGLGTAMRHIEAETGAVCYGYDTHPNYYEGDPFKFRTSLYFKVDCIFFMHSIAHIKQPLELIRKLRADFIDSGGRFVVITPNRDWLDVQPFSTDYTPDPTVIRHFSPVTLSNLFTNAGCKVEICGQFGAVSQGVHERVFLVANA